MRLGMFDFRKDDTDDQPDVDVETSVESNGSEASSPSVMADESVAGLDDLWTSLGEELAGLDLGDFDAALDSSQDRGDDEVGALLDSLLDQGDGALLESLTGGHADEVFVGHADEVFVGPTAHTDEPYVDVDPKDNGAAGTEFADLISEETPSAEGDELPSLAETAHNAVSGMVTDEIVLSLLHAGEIRVADIFEALRNRMEGVPLWRALLQVAGVNQSAVLEQVALHRDYERATIPADAPVQALVSNMREQLSEQGIDEVLSLGAVPIELGIDAETLQYRIVVAAADPAHPELAAWLADLPMQTELLYAPWNEVARTLESNGIAAPDAGRLVVGDLGDPSHALEAGAIPAPLAEAEDESPGSDVEESDSADTSEPLRRIPSGRHGMPDRGSDRDSLSRTEDGSERAKSVSWPAEDKTEDEDSSQASSVPAAEEALVVEPISEEQAAGNLERIDRRARKDRVVATLVRSGAVTPDKVNEAVKKHAADGSREAIWRVLAGLTEMDRERIFSEAARVYAFPEVEIGPGQPDHEFVMLIMETIAEERRDELLKLNLLPYEYAIDAESGGARLIFITHDPARSDVHRILAQLKLGRFELRYASERGISGVITEIFPQRNEFLDRIDGNQAYDLGASFEEAKDLVDENALEAEMSRSGLINLFEASLLEGVRLGASDIHVFPNPKRQVEIHFRVDGRLKKWHTEEKVHAESFLAVVKDNSMNVDRFERDAAQDGYIQRRIDDSLIRFRVSVLPVASANQEIRAESIVIRILDDRKVLTDLSKLGMLDGAMASMNHAIRQPHGMVILTGPTGSGKSTTLVAALHQVITPEVNVLSIEDPVEYIINGVRQIKLSHKLDLEQAIRAVLRHDPDIVMVGEMRDKATADLAIKLANTGHLTFSTLHTNDAPSAVSRLFKMGVEPFLIAYAINLVVAQRLIRGLCPNCKIEDTERDPIIMKRAGFTEDEIANQTIYTAAHGSTCNTCNGGGYKGRRAVSETLYFTQTIRHMIAESGEEIDEERIRQAAVAEGMLTLQDSARELVKMGVTSLGELMRVTASE